MQLEFSSRQRSIQVAKSKMQAKQLSHESFSRRLFAIWLRRTEKLLEAGIGGIDDSLKKSNELAKKLETAKPDPTGEHKSGIKDPWVTDDGTIVVSGKMYVDMIIDAMKHDVEFTEGVKFHLNGIVLVALWSSFEGYIQSVGMEIFRANPELLSSEKTLSYAEVVENRGNVIDRLIMREVEDLGRKSFEEMHVYLKSRFKVQIASKFQSKMRDAYFLRNVLAHAAGYVRDDQVERVPEQVDVVNHQLHISPDYLRDLTECIESAVRGLDRRLANLYLQGKKGEVPPALVA